jgi:hypothetical protein
LLEYNITWSTLTISPIEEYLIMYRMYQVEKNSWRIIAVPERKLPRGFIVTASHTLRGLQPNISYEMKVAAVNTHGQGEWSKLIHFLLNFKGKTFLI